MAETTSGAPPLNLTPSEPELKDILALWRKDILLSLSCHHLVTIQSFNPANQTATATVNYQKTFYDYDPETQQYTPTQVSYPVLLDCPVVVLGGGGGALTFPVSPGDQGIALFNDRSIDTWFQGGGGTVLSSARLHSFSDAIIIVGVRSLSGVLAGYDPSDVVLRNGATTKVSVSTTDAQLVNATTQVGTDGTLALIKTTAGGTLGAALASLMNDLNQAGTGLVPALSAFATTCGGSTTDPTLVTAAATLKLALTSLATALTSLATTLGEILA